VSVRHLSSGCDNVNQHTWWGAHRFSFRGRMRSVVRIDSLVATALSDTLSAVESILD
jgi:hypothetical protein